MKPKVWIGGDLNGIGITPGLITRRSELDELTAALRLVAPWALRCSETHPELRAAMDMVYNPPGAG